MSDRLKSARLTAAAVLALLLFNYPFLAVFDLDTAGAGCPGVVGLSVGRVGRRHRARGVDFEVLMLDTWVIVGASVAYLGLLFAIAYYGDRRADRRRSIISNGYIYALSLCVYATSWTYYGSVGRAATTGVGFLPIYLGPTIMAVVWWLVLRKIIRICKRYRITSLADFVSVPLRQEQSARRAGDRDRRGRDRPLHRPAAQGHLEHLHDPSRPARPRHRGRARTRPSWPTRRCMSRSCSPPSRSSSAPATSTPPNDTRAWSLPSRSSRWSSWSRSSPSAAYVTFGLFGGFGDLFGRAQDRPELARLLTFGETQSYASWLWLIVLSMFAILLLPRQWQVAVVENVDERHIKTASWLFPLYLLLINIFVMPIAIAGLLTFGDGGAGGDAYVLALPMADQQAALALLVFIGGLSAATGMVIVETIALSTMVSNSLVLPSAAAVRRWTGRAARPRAADPRDPPSDDRGGSAAGLRLLPPGRRVARAGVHRSHLLRGGCAVRACHLRRPVLAGRDRGRRDLGARGRLRRVGLHAAVAVPRRDRLRPRLLHRGGTVRVRRPGTPRLVRAGRAGPRQPLHAVEHAGQRRPVRRPLADRPPEVRGTRPGLDIRGRLHPLGREADPRLWRGTVSVDELQGLLGRFLGPEGARAAFASYADRTGTDVSPDAGADADLVHHVETLLAGAVGSASARFMVASVVDEEPLAVSEVVQILDETSQVLAYSRALERKSEQLELATSELRGANSRLQELDRLKDDFVSTISHELRTPLTSIRAFSEILLDNPDLDPDERAGYLRIVVDETERLTRLINQVLDLSKLESGSAEWQIAHVDLGQVLTTSMQATAQIFSERGVVLEMEVPEPAPVVRADADRLVQVMLNLLSNAVKFCPPGSGRVQVVVEHATTARTG